MTTTQDITRYRGATLVDRDGDKIGSIDEIYLDQDTGRPEWLAVKTGMFGTRLSFVPIAEANQSGDELRVGGAYVACLDGRAGALVDGQASGGHHLGGDRGGLSGREIAPHHPHADLVGA